MPYFPMFVDLKNKKCIVVGGGAVAKRKADTLISFGAKVTVVADEILYDFKSCNVVNKKFEAADITKDYFMAVAATDNRTVNKNISDICRGIGINVNVADSSSESDFIFGAVYKKDNMVIAVNSGENNPSKSKRVKNDIMNFVNTIKIGTRKSRLAKIQANIVAELIKKIDGSINCEIVELSASADKNLDKSLRDFGGKGAFTDEFERAIVEGKIDIAVHSGKDLPVELFENLEIIATPKREMANDVLVTLKNKALNEKSIIGTGSIRRRLQLDYNVKDIRGNVDTRLAKLERGEYDGVVLAAAGLKRLGFDSLEKYDYKIFGINEFYPAPCQGIIAVECHKNSRFRELLKKISDDNTYICFMAERQLLTELGTGCQFPLGAYSFIEGDNIVLQAVCFGKNKKYFKGSDKKENAVKLAKKGSDILKENLK